METINEQKNSEIGPENIGYREFWGHSMANEKFEQWKDKVNYEFEHLLLKG